MKIENEESANCQICSESADVPFNDWSSKPKVSLFIISYNQKKFIEEAIESAVNQDYENLEIIISDDGSTDGTADIVAQWQRRYPERLIALLNRDNVGITRNCNRALRSCTGDLIAMFGGDDVLLPGKISAQVDWFQQDSRRVLCGHQIEYISENGLIIPSLNSPTLREGRGPKMFIRHGQQLPAQSIMIRASAIPSHGFDESIPIASDFLFFIDVLSNDGAYGYVNGVYAQYRDHGANVSKNYSEMLRDVEKTYKIIGSRYPQYRSICSNSIIEHVSYFGGVRYLKLGDKIAARKKFCEAILKKPFLIRAWVRLIQTL